MSRYRRSILILALVFIIGGVMHFLVPLFYLGMMPPWLPAPRILVFLSGICEICGGLGVLSARVRRVAGWGLIALLIAVFPANVEMAIQARATHASLWLFGGLAFVRLPLQSYLIVWVWRTTAVRFPSPAI